MINRLRSKDIINGVQASRRLNTERNCIWAGQFSERTINKLGFQVVRYWEEIFGTLAELWLNEDSKISENYKQAAYTIVENLVYRQTIK